VTIKKIALLLGLFLLAVPTVFSIDNLKLNEHLDYGSDSLDGPLITGSDAQSGFVPGKPNYVIIYGEGCFNSKRQARGTVVIDLDVQRSPEQQQLVKVYYKGYIPHVLVLNGRGEPVYNQSGEVDSRVIEDLFNGSASQ
jgi:hypothetical protein